MTDSRSEAHDTDPSELCIHVIGALAAGGAERFVVDLVRELARLGRRVELLVLSSRTDEAGEAMMASLAADGIPVEIGPTDRVRLRTIAWYARTLRRKPDAIVHLHTTNTELIHVLTLPLVGRRFEVVRTIHNTVLPEHGPSGFAFRHLPASVSIACGESAMERHGDRLKGRVRAIANGVDFDWSIRSAESSAEAKRALGLDAARVHLVCVGRMTGASPEDSQKAHDVLIRAWQKSTVGDRAQLHLLGDGELRPELEVLAAGDPSIRFHGVTKDVRTWLIAADGFVMPSRWEGLPIAGIEAVGTGLPCLFSDIPSLRELRAPCVSMSSAGDEDALAESLLGFVDEPRAPERNVVAEFRERYGIGRAAREYEEVYRSLVAE